MKKGTWFPLALSGLFFGADKFIEAHGGGSGFGPVMAGGAVVATAVGSYLNNLAAAHTDKELNEGERLALASKNHHLRRSMARALRRGLAAAQEEIRSRLPDIYGPLFSTWDRLLDQADSSNDTLDRVFPPILAEPHWQAINNYRTSPDDDSRALSDLLREWLTPNLTLLAEWSAPDALTFSRLALPYYRQAFADEIALDRDGFSFHSFVVKALQESGAKLDQILDIVKGEQRQRRSTGYALPRLGLFIGRDGELKIAQERWLRKRERPLLIHGPPGIGKSKLALALLHDDTVTKRFGSRRYRIRCDPFKTAEEVVSGMGLEWFGITPSDTIEGEVIAELQSGECALVIDNFETPYRADTAASDALLQRLLGVEHLWLIVAIQGFESPVAVSWAEPMVPSRLGIADAAQLFCEVSRNPAHIRDPRLEGLLRDLDGVPHAIQLLGAQAEGEDDLQGVARRWRAERTRLLQRGGDHSRETDIEVAYEFAIASPAMVGGPRKLLFILASLPGGVAEDDLEIIFEDEEALRSLKQVRRAALVFKESGRFRMLAPLREYVLRAHGAGAVEMRAARKHYLTLAAKGQSLGQTGSEGILPLLTSEYANILWFLERAIEESEAGATEPALGLAQFIWFRGLPDREILRKTQQAARKRDDPLADAKCGALLGRFALRDGFYEEAIRCVNEARLNYLRAGDRSGEACCIRRLVRPALHRGQLEDAERHCQNALSRYRHLGDATGEADCFVDLAELAWYKKQPLEMKQWAEKALTAYQGVGNRLGQAVALGDLGLAAWDISELETAAQHFRDALSINREIGFKYNEAWCVAGLAKLARQLSQLETAQQQLKEALALYRELGVQSGVVSCIDDLGSLAMSMNRLEDARLWYRDSLALARDSGDREPEAWCLDNLARVALGSGDLDLAREHIREASNLFQKIGNRSGEADCLRLSGLLATRLHEHLEARSLLERALAMSHEIGAIDTEAECREGLKLISESILNFGSPEELLAEGINAATSALLRAAGNGNIGRLKNLLAAGISANSKDPDSGRTALHFAAEASRLAADFVPQYDSNQSADRVEPSAIILSLLQHGSGVNDQDAWGRTALHVACALDLRDVVRCLLDNGADFNIEDADGFPPLFVAAQGGAGDSAELVLSAGAPANQVNSRGLTALAVASRAGREYVMKILLGNRANPNFTTAHRIVPLVEATQLRQVSSVDLLCRYGAAVDAQDARGMSALMYGSWFGCAGIVELLIQHGANLHQRGPARWTPLMFAADAIRIAKDPASVKRTIDLLCQAGCSRSDRDAHGRSPCDIALLAGADRAIASLLSCTSEAAL